MQLVINIPYFIYDGIRNLTDTGIIEDNAKALYNAIYRATPLPKGHGRLISEEELVHLIMFSKLFDDAKVGEIKEVLSTISTIVKADTESDG